MNAKQQSAFNTFLKSSAALLLAFVEEKSESEKSPEAPPDDMLGGEAPDDMLGETPEDDKAKKDREKKEKAEAKAKEKAEKEAKEKAEKEAKEKAEKEKPAEPPPSEIKKTDPDALLADARAAAVAYAGKHGREALRTVLNEFTPTPKSTIAEVPKDKLPALIAKLRA